MMLKCPEDISFKPPQVGKDKVLWEGTQQVEDVDLNPSLEAKEGVGRVFKLDQLIG